jgi:sec-independent protein translocase protein TatB
MLDIAWSEMVVIAVVALIVVGPRDLPPLLRQLGRMIGQFKRMAADFHSQFNDAIKEAELDDLKKEIEELRRSAGSAFMDTPPKNKPHNGENLPPAQQNEAAPLPDPVQQQQQQSQDKAAL